MSTTLAGGRIPIRLEPVPGESFDGWLDAYGQRLLLSGRDVGYALGLPPELLRLHGANVALGGPAPDPEQIAWRACGLDPAVIAALWFGLSRYHRLVAGRTASKWFARVLRVMVSSRYCPACLKDSGGRWLAAWRLPWYLACPTHRSILVSGCPACGGTQRFAGLRVQYVRDLLTACSRPTAGRAGRRDSRCRHDLTGTASPVSATDELIVLQAELSSILDPAVSDRDAVKLVDRLVDRLIIATHVGLDLRAIDRDRRNMAGILAGPLADAHRALSDPHGARMRTIATGDRARVQCALPQAWDGTSPALTALVLKHRDQRLGPTDRLRYRSMTGVARRPERAEPSTRMRALPLALWPDWSIRLRPPALDHPKRFRIAAAIALCLPGTTVPLGSIRDRWPGPDYKQRMVLFARFITAHPNGTAILAALCALADNLDQHGAPIDYARRRALASQIELLDRDAWTVMCRAGGIATGAECKLAHARLWLWEALTGGPPQQAPAALRPDYHQFLSHHNRFALRLPAPTVRRLTDRARQLLDSQGCVHEPLTWSPSGEGIRLDQLPGSDPDALDPQLVHAALAQGQPPRKAAQALGITLEQLYYVARKHPSEPAEHPAPPRARLAALLTKEQLRELVNQGHSLHALEKRYGIDRRTIRNELVTHGIPIPPTAQRRRR